MSTVVGLSAAASLIKPELCKQTFMSIGAKIVSAIIPATLCAHPSGYSHRVAGLCRILSFGLLTNRVLK